MANANEQMAQRLSEAGYFVGLPEDEAEELRENVAAEGYAAALDHPTRMAFADIENLAEGMVGAWLANDIAPLLTPRGISIPPFEEHFPEDPEDGYSIDVGGKVYWMSRGNDDDNQATATAAAFAIVNDLLSATSSDERLYFLDNGGGNDGMAWLLTSEQVRIIRETSGLPPSGTPFIPTSEPPHYGQPQ